MENVQIETYDVSPEYKRPIDNRIAHPAIWLDETAHDQIAVYEKLKELIIKQDLIGLMSLVDANKHYWAGIRDGNRFMRNPFKQDS